MANIKDSIPLSGPATSQNIIAGITEAFSKGATKVLGDKTKPYIIFTRPPKDSEEETPENLAVYLTIRQREIIDYEEIEGQPFHKSIFDMFMIINDKGLYPAYVLVKHKKDLGHLLGIPRLGALDILFGARVYEYEEVEPETLLISACSTKNPDPLDIVLTVKGYLNA